jgi:hypothetical protein
VGIIVSALSAIIWFSVDIISGHTHSSSWLGVWNTIIRLVSFLAITLAVSKIREMLITEKELSARLQETLNHVKELRGLLPICAWCKKVKNDQGYWEQIESYVRKYSRAEFSPGICPECAKSLYPEHFIDEEPPSSPDLNNVGLGS